MIRDADPEADAVGCLEIYAPFVSDTTVSFEDTVPTVEEFRARIVATTRTHPWLVLEDAGRVVGYAYGSTHRARAAYRWTAEVTAYLAPSHRGVGAGRRLYEALFERLRRQGFHLAVAGITLPNEASVGLHRAMGFRPVGVYERIGWKAGAWCDVAWFQLDLGDRDDGPPVELRPPDAK